MITPLVLLLAQNVWVQNRCRVIKSLKLLILMSALWMPNPWLDSQYPRMKHWNYPEVQKEESPKLAMG